MIVRDDHTQPTANRVTHERSLFQALANCCDTVSWNNYCHAHAYS